MHKHCGLNKWEIWDYTLPQVTELMKRANQYIEFEISMKGSPFGMFGGGGGVAQDETQVDNEADYSVATEEDIMDLARILGGGA